MAKVNLDDNEGAIPDYTEVIKLNPKHGDAYAGRGISYIILGNKESGCNDLKKRLS